LVGFGRSAKAVARRAKGFGLKVIATRRNTHIDDAEAKALVDDMTDLETLLRESDYVSLHLPLNEETRGLFDAKRMSMMKPSAILVNTSRGALVDEKALAEALHEGRLAGAGLDTFHNIDVHQVSDGQRPCHPLLELENCVFTPHVAAFSVESARDVADGAVENMAAVLSGRWPAVEHVVNANVTPRLELRFTAEKRA
jgi:phosphoglycerate dehydrogenase-like enzyme